MKNFFDHQDQARQKTHYLVFLFGCAIAATVALLYTTLLLTDVAGTVSAANSATDPLSDPLSNPLGRPEYLAGAIAIALATIGFGSGHKIHSLRGGGPVVAASLGGQPVSQDTTNPQEKELLNVVAEMAIASGTAVPKVYLLPDSSINAFAAGFDPNDAVIGVTQGALSQLSRDELQGVIGHEFSHIVNGDMRLNIKLIGLVHGLLFMHIVGREILFRGQRVSFKSSEKKGVSPMLIVGASMLAIGGVGWIFGQLIKSAVSRQREFLADAAAVQFTRDANGLANALRRIGSGSGHSPIASAQAASASHLFFNEISALSSFMTPFATHPPLAKRIRRLGGRPSAPKPSLPQQPVEAVTALSASAVIGNVGTVTPAGLAQAHTLLGGLPEPLLAAARSPAGAIAIIYGLLLNPEASVRAQQKQIVAESSTTVANLLAEIEPLFGQVDARISQGKASPSRLPLVELCIPSLRTLKPGACAQFFNQIKALARADGKLSLSEYALQTVLQYRLAPHFQPAPPLTAATTHLSEVWPECQLLLATLAKVGHDKSADAEYAFRNGLSYLPTKGCPPASSVLPACSLPELSRVLKRLRLAVPQLKQSIAGACAYTVLTDGRTTDQEAELLRAVLIALGCPVPPFLNVAG